MSNENNTRLIETANELIERWTGTMSAKLLEQDLKSNDMESLHNHVMDIGLAEMMANASVTPASDVFENMTEDEVAEACEAITKQGV